jgi:Fe-Mn family superoxide dismutase
MFVLPALPYPVSALEPYLDTATLEIHHGKHHAAYVKNLNDALPDKNDSDLVSILSNLGTLPESLRTKVKNHGGGHANHSLFWTFMTPKSSPPTGKLLLALNSTFGDLEAFKAKFTAAAMGRFGSGWAWLVADKSGLAIVDTANQDSPLSVGQTPLLCLDVWEHAYYLKYQNRRADYITAWWNVVNWAEVSARFGQL